jgi:LPXTG-site transpeptidase (sortase) family protein
MESIVKLLNNVNTGLTFLLIVIGAYIFIFPMTPEIVFALNKNQELPEIVIDQNYLRIEKILVNGQIFNGESKEELNKGFWKLPNSSTPDKGGNTVIVAHRFLYTSGPNTFYHLDKLKINDEIEINWNQRLYKYKVREIREVNPTNIKIEENTDRSILTLYTCTPLWTAEKRLVVIADLITI